MRVVSLNEKEQVKSSNSIWNVECIKCGYTTTQSSSHLKIYKRKQQSGCLYCKMPNEDLTGQIFATTKVLGVDVEYTKKKKDTLQNKETYWLCECIKCHYKFTRSEHSLKEIGNRNLGFCKMCPKVDLTGKKFGRWTVLEWAGRQKIKRSDRSNATRSMWRCECECGEIRDVQEMGLLQGTSTSCGCYQRENAKSYARDIAKKYLTQRKENIYDLSGEYGICYNEDKSWFCYFDLEDYDLIRNYYWNRRSINGTYGDYASAKDRVHPEKNCSIFMHRLIMGLNGDNDDKSVVVDHINHMINDNRKENLRICTQSQNHMNASLPNHNRTGLKGVSWEESSKTWVARIGLNYKYKILGRYNTAEEAVVARKAAEEKYYGEYAYDPEKDMRFKFV